MTVDAGKDEPKPRARNFSVHLFFILLALVTITLFMISALQFTQSPKMHWKMPKATKVDSTVSDSNSVSKYGAVLPEQAFVVTGVRTGFSLDRSTRPVRQDIAQLEQSGPAFDLYIQCQNELMAREQNDILSYYQIAAIHQKPFKLWNGVSNPLGIKSGYAPHESLLFPVWHRPYVAMYEQLICECGLSLAAKYPPPVREIYQAAALTLRLPYWDWARNHSLPAVVTEQTCLIRTPTGVKDVKNPLYRYDFHPTPGSVGSPDEEFVIGKFRKLQYTVRNLHDDEVMNIEELNQRLHTDGQFMEFTYKILTKLNGSYAHFSNKASSEVADLDQGLSIENIHNHVHELVAGHMGTDYASFDPLFWLHHVNIDRILALWQAMYPNSYVTPQTNLTESIGEAYGTLGSLDSLLVPFARNDSGMMHTAQTVRYITDFGYSYPELHFWMSETELAANVTAQVTELYGNKDLWDGRDTGY